MKSYVISSNLKELEACLNEIDDLFWPANFLEKWTVSDLRRLAGSKGQGVATEG